MKKNKYMILQYPYMTSNNRENLADYVRRLMYEKRLSGDAISRASRGQIAQSTIDRIKNGIVLNPSVGKLKALAKGLGVTEAELFAVARGTTDPNIVDERLANISEVYSRLSGGAKEKADFLIGIVEKEIAALAPPIRDERRTSVGVLKEAAR